MFKCVLIPLILLLSVQGVKGQNERLLDSATALIEQSTILLNHSFAYDSMAYDSKKRITTDTCEADMSKHAKEAILFNTQSVDILRIAMIKALAARKIILRVLQGSNHQAPNSTLWKHIHLSTEDCLYALQLYALPSSSFAGRIGRTN